VENIAAVCTVRPGDNDGIQHNFSREAFTSVQSYTRALGRALEVVPAGAAAAGSSAPPAISPANVSSVPAPSPSNPAPGAPLNVAEAGAKASQRTATRESFRAAIQVTVR
jgi:hypothetical protein